MGAGGAKLKAGSSQAI